MEHALRSAVRRHGGVRRAAALLACLTISAIVSPSAQAAPTASGPSATASSGTASALADGDVGQRQLGAEWKATDQDPAPWVQLTWSAPRRLASVQVFGSTANAFDPKQSTAAALYGTLVFSDSSRVVVSGIAPRAGMPTTVAFAPRAATSVRLELKRQIATAPVALREFSAYSVGSTPPRWQPLPGTSAATLVPAASSCTGQPPSVALPAPGQLTLSCPTPGSSVGADATVVVNAPPGADVVGWVAAGRTGGSELPLRRAANSTADSRGRAVLQVSTADLPQGPVVVKVTATSGGAPLKRPLYVQLFRAHGSTAPAARTAPVGMTLQYEDEFDVPLSVTQYGWDAQYAALKPESWGGSQFGLAAFANPSWGAQTMANLPGGYLRLRVQPIGDLMSKATWKQPHVGGLLSSQRFGGSGFSAQYGYFEARILGAPGPGAWPAFWMMNSESGTSRTDRKNGELDAVELYGHNTVNACHSTHAWGQDKGSDGERLCRNLSSDWAAQWHTYGARVTPGGADFYVDGVKVGELDQLAHTDEPFFFMLDLATAGGWPVDLSATGDVTDMYVDWVRVYT